MLGLDHEIQGLVLDLTAELVKGRDESQAIAKQKAKRNGQNAQHGRDRIHRERSHVR